MSNSIFLIHHVTEGSLVRVPPKLNMFSLFLGYLQPAVNIVYNKISDKAMLKTQLLPCSALNCSKAGCVLDYIPNAQKRTYKDDIWQ